MPDILDSDIKFLPGVGPKRAEVLKKELNIFTWKDLLYYFPYKYIDKSKIFRISEIQSVQAHIQLKGRITTFKFTGVGRRKRLSAIFSDDTGAIELTWFQGHKWVQDSYKIGQEYIVFGKPSVFGNRISIAHPEIETVQQHQEQGFSAFQAQYSLTEKAKNQYISSKTLSKLLLAVIKDSRFSVRETLPVSLIEKLNLMSLQQAIKELHFPQSNDLLVKAPFRIKFEELFFIQLNILSQKVRLKNNFAGFVFSQVGEYLNTFYKENLPFELTGAQKRVIKEIRKDLGSGKQMNRLLQGDVGSGKTLVALMCMLIALDNGFQTCLMAPTEILATQHYHTITKMVNRLDVNIELLTGSTKQSKRNTIIEELQNGRLNILIGTHALIEDYVDFGNLGLVIVDEQHRFGVAQRAKLWKKNTQPPHVLVMTATPIPRTLAMTLYGDLDVSVIDELPPGRKPIKTHHYFDTKRLKLFGFMREQIKQGRQIYVVYPLIKESETLDYKDLEDGYESIVRAFPAPEYTVAIVHGKMKPKEKDIAMEHFKSGRAQILVSTTVIEVGVDVPNATVMIIESAERFGLSQLHQLRGRVGRGGDQSYCILMTSYKLTHEARKRIDVMVETNDGFEIAEADLKLRGPGDIEGTQQSGVAFNLRLANLAKDGQILQYARNIAESVLADDPDLSAPDNAILKSELLASKNTVLDWSRIS